MTLTIATTNHKLDPSIAVKAHNLYKEAKYAEALPLLQQILDVEPNNWHAKLFLGACYFKTSQPMAAERTLRAVYDKCPDQELKQKACFALQTIKAAVESPVKNPWEFGDYKRNEHAPGTPMEHIIR